jgi:hypothetical protein
MSEDIKVQVSELSKEQIAVSQQFMSAMDALWSLNAQARRQIYHRFEMLKLFTPKMSEVFEQNLRRINKRIG